MLEAMILRPNLCGKDTGETRDGASPLTSKVEGSNVIQEGKGVLSPEVAEKIVLEVIERKVCRRKFQAQVLAWFEEKCCRACDIAHSF